MDKFTLYNVGANAKRNRTGKGIPCMCLNEASKQSSYTLTTLIKKIKDSGIEPQFQPMKGAVVVKYYPRKKLLNWIKQLENVRGS